MDTKHIFNNNLTEGKEPFPPNQVFINENFEFTLTIGGNLVENEAEYEKLMLALKIIGETTFFYIREYCF